MSPNVPGLGGSMRASSMRGLRRSMNRMLPRNQKTPMPRSRNKAGSMGAIRNPTRNMQSLRGFGRY